MLFSRFATYIFNDFFHLQTTNIVSFLSLWAAVEKAKLPWNIREVSVGRTPKVSTKTPKVRENFVRKPWKKSVRRLKSRVQTIADIRACALQIENMEHVSWMAGSGQILHYFFLYKGRFSWPKLHMKSWTMTKKSTFLYDQSPSFHDIASIPCFFKTSNCTFGVFHERPQNLRSFGERPQKLGWLEYQGKWFFSRQSHGLLSSHGFFEPPSGHVLRGLFFVYVFWFLFSSVFLGLPSH